MANGKIGPYSGKGGIGQKTNDKTGKDMGSLDKADLQRTGKSYDEHQKAVASKDSSILKRNRVPEYRQQ